MRILVTGKNGYTAKAILKKLEGNIITIGREDFDLTDSEATSKWFKKNGYFDVVIHTAIVGGSRFKVEEISIMDQNLQMYYNLLSSRTSYGKFINLSSGAEISFNTPYGVSKKIISKSILEKRGFYNIRIWAVFDEDELDTRFIKTCLKNYINKEPMLIENKKMSFFYMGDLIKLIKHHIDTDIDSLIGESNCAYVNSTSLLDIANIINELDVYKVPIYMNNNSGEDYISHLNAPYAIDYIGLKQGIKNVYSKLKNI